MAEISSGTVRGRWGLTVVTALFGGLVSYVIQRVLGAWGVLDPVADAFGKWLKVSVSAGQAGWTIALLIVVAVYAFILWKIWRPIHVHHLPIPAETKPEASCTLEFVPDPSTSQAVPVAAPDEEESLDIIAQYWIPNRSAWGRWQRAMGSPVEDDTLLGVGFCASVIFYKAQAGELVITARPSSNIDREELSRDFWQVAYLGVRQHPTRNWQVFIRPYDGLSDEVIAKIRAKDYVHPCARWSDIKRLWPEADPKTDAETARLLSENIANA